MAQIILAAGGTIVKTLPKAKRGGGNGSGLHIVRVLLLASYGRFFSQKSEY